MDCAARNKYNLPGIAKSIYGVVPTVFERVNAKMRNNTASANPNCESHDSVVSVGNSELISSEDEMLASFLRERNLNRVNYEDSLHAIQVADGIYVRYVKRALDLAIGIPAFLITAPVNAVFGICTFLDVGRPILYKQTRIGKDGKPFIMVKFRNMNNNRDENGNLLPAAQRVTKFGHFMRKYSLDELLNFWSVVKGDMSIIGPRPLPEFFVDRMSERHKMRHVVRPGLECPARIPDNSNLSPFYWKFEKDVWYVENVSFKTDVKLMLELLEMALDMGTRGRHADGNTYFIGYDDDGHPIGLLLARKLYETVRGASDAS